MIPNGINPIRKPKITSKRFIDSIHRFKWEGLSIENYWNDGKNGHNAIFLDYKNGFKCGGEYIKIYCDANFYSYPNLKIRIYLLNRGERMGLNRKGEPEYKDLLMKTFCDWKEYEDYIKNILLKEIKELNNTKKDSYE